MTSILAAIIFIIPAFLLYSPKVEKNRIVTITKPMVITQERKTPAYYLYQQVKITEKQSATAPALTTYLSSQSYVPPQPSVRVTELRVDRREIASAVDAGFATAAILPAATLATNPKDVSNPALDAMKFIQQPEQTKLSPATKWATVRGKFESRGIGVIDQIIELKRIEEGQVRELGRVDLKAGLYSIDIESPRGILIAQIKDRNGIIIGEDSQQILNLLSRGQYFEGPFIQVHNPGVMASAPDIPASRDPGKGIARTNGLLGARNKSGASKTVAFVTTLFSNQNTLEDPTDEFSNVSKNSSTVAYVSDPSNAYRKVLTIRQTGDQNKTPLFSEKWSTGMLEYISDQQKLEFKSNQVSIVIGKISVDGKPTAGAQVQIENHPGVYPIYLDQFMIPKVNQTETTENGYFMFVGLENANYTVSAFKQGQIIGHQMFIAEEGAVSYQNILSSSTAHSVLVRSFDAFSSDPVEIDLTTPDLEEIIQTAAGSASYRNYNQLGVTQFLVRTNDQNYLPVRYFQDARKEYVHVPMLQEAWLKKIQAERMINEEPNTSTFVGFVPDFNYDVYLVSEGYSRDKVVYFDTIGKISPIPVKGGGFILFNVPAEAHEIVVQEEGNDRIYSQVIDSNAGQVGVAHFVE